VNYYYHPDPDLSAELNSDESHHAIKVLRKKKGDQISIMDGMGNAYLAEITDDNFRKCCFSILEKESHPKKSFSIHIAIAPTKNSDRIEWFVEKACELGTDEIFLVMTERTERSKVNLERLEKKAISALKQSKNFWKCDIHEAIKFDDFIKTAPDFDQKFIAFVETGKEESLKKLVRQGKSVLVMIGPEGDFTKQEITQAISEGFIMVNLGHMVLRTETAGIIAAHTISLANP